MKKRLLTLGALALVVSTNAQVVTTQFTTVVANNASVYASNKSLIYNGGGVKTVQDGKIDNSGNIMVVGNNNSKFATVTSAGAAKVDGGNIIMNMTDETVGSLRYGQLYVKGLAQANITGIVDKEFKDVANGSYQQVALPFYNKLVSELSTELGKNFSNTRWSQDEILVYDNALVKSDLVNLSSRIQNAIAYYMLGSKNFNAAAAVKVVKGVPYADGISQLLKDAGNGVDFGTDGTKPNIYRERYNSYLQDTWDYSSGAWANNYGRNIYQFGNPYLTNLDLGQLGKVIPNLQGVRVESEGVTTSDTAGTLATSSKIISYASGVAVGDNNAIIRPMQTFVVKLSDNRGVTLNFDDLRRFAYTPRTESEPYKVNALSVSSEGNSELVAMSSRTSRLDVVSSSTVKQLAIIALNGEGEEIGRTYYVVYADGVSGKPEKVSAQAIASSRNIIGTFEETKDGGLDEELSTSYWLYINETNENDFKGKKVPLRLYSNDIKSLKFEIKENASEIKDGQEKLSSGESFYIDLGNSNVVAVNNGKSIPLSSTSAEFGLYYGKPSSAIDNAVTSSKLVKPSDTFVAFDTNNNNYKLVFDSTWKTANVQVFDISGRLILSQNNVNTVNGFIINLPSKGVYIVNATSETGHKFSQKVIK